MSNLYVTEPSTNGKVIMDTSVGDIEVELWGKEAPKAVRNFLTLILEGYYDGVIFHRVVPGFIVQTGDPSGTGMGGESVYGEPFEDEIHPRLKFNRRGLLAMANNGAKNTNTSQFFITLDRADELQGKHTMFGKITGPTVFNALKIGNIDVDKEERPLVPPKIHGMRIIENPFPDIVPRITAAERKAQAAARLQAKQNLERLERRQKHGKNTKLLSFGEEEEVMEVVGVKKKQMGRADLMEADGPAARGTTFEDLPAALRDGGKAEGGEKEKDEKEATKVNLATIRAQHDRDRAGGSAQREAEIKKMQEDLRKLKKRTGGGDDSSDDESDDEARKRRRQGPSALDQEIAKYSSNKGRAAKAKSARRAEDEDLLAEMSSFAGRVKLATLDQGDVVEEAEQGEDAEAVKGDGGPTELEEEEPLEVDDDVGWLSHALKSDKGNAEQVRRAEDDYLVIDPRAKARELAAEKPKTRKGDRNYDKRAEREKERLEVMGKRGGGEMKPRSRMPDRGEV